MSELTLLQSTSAYVTALVVFIFTVIAYIAGHYMRRRAIRKDPEHVKIEIKTINGMLIGLLGLLLAFTFSMSNARFDDRRHLIIQEANIIGTTVLRTDMYPDSVRTLLRSTLKEYVERRIAFFQAGMDLNKARSEYNAGQELSAKVWRIVTEYAKKDDVTTRTAQLIPSLNDMIDVTTTRLAAGMATIPDSIMYLLFILCFCSAFLLGYDDIAKPDWIVIAGFSVTLSVTVFIIIDLDRPRTGLINMNSHHQKMVELRQMFIND